MKKYRQAADILVGVVGYGGAFNMGKWHLNEMKRAQMSPRAVVEIDPKRLDAARADFPGIETYSSVEEMLKESDVNLVTLITPHNTHAPLAVKCLNAGRHVVCEKPMAITTAECDAMIRAARANKVVLSTYHNRHWDGAIIEGAKLVRQGVLGHVFRAEAHMGGWGQPSDWWRTSRTISGGILYDWGVHLLEYCLQTIDSKIVDVTGFAKEGFWAPKTRWKHDTNEDEGFAVVRFANGAWLTLNMSSLESNPHPSRIEITGTKGSFVMISDREYEVYTHDGNKTIVTKAWSPESQGWRLYQNIADHLVKGAKLIITAEWARRPIHIIDLAVQSARLRRPLKAKYG
jgi:predicted dehydrogenase